MKAVIVVLAFSSVISALFSEPLSNGKVQYDGQVFQKQQTQSPISLQFGKPQFPLKKNYYGSSTSNQQHQLPFANQFNGGGGGGSPLYGSYRQPFSSLLMTPQSVRTPQKFLYSRRKPSFFHLPPYTSLFNYRASPRTWKVNTTLKMPIYSSPEDNLENRGRSAHSHCKITTPAENKEQVLRAYQSALGDHISDNLERDFATDYIQHNPDVADGLEAFRQVIISLQSEDPFKVEFHHAAAEDNLVWLHSKLPYAGKINAVMDIFRIECGKIQEHWDVMQDTDLTTPAANSHPFF